MKNITALGAALTSLGLATPAAAFHYSVGAPPFVSAVTDVFAVGQITLTQASMPTTCNTQWKFRVRPNGKAKIINATFTGSSACAAIMPQSLPWIGKPDTASHAFHVITVSTVANGPCGGFQGFTLVGGFITFNNTFGPPQNCTFATVGPGLNTNPTGPLTIQP